MTPEFLFGLLCDEYANQALPRSRERAPKMTATEILSLPAGPELNQLVAEKVMGQVWQGGNPVPSYDGRWPWPPPYSTDIAAAWEVAEAVDCFGFSVGRSPEGYRCTVTDGRQIDATADTAPLAICRAALQAVAAG